MFTWNELEPEKEAAPFLWREIPPAIVSPLTFYDELGLTPSATSRQIKQAFRQKALELHPDRTSGHDHDAMARLNEIYQTLGSAERRKAYDAQR